MRTLAAAMALVMVTTSAWAQSAPAPVPSREETFRQIGRSLEGIGNSLNPPPQVLDNPTTPVTGPNASFNWSKMNATGATLTAGTTVTGLASPNPTATAAATLTPGTKVQFQGYENGFVKIAPLEGPASGRTVWVPQGTAQATFVSSYIDTKIGEAMEKVARLAAAIENNPYVRLKGFKLSVSISPSIDVEFEMKGGDGASAPATSIAKPPAPQ